MLYLLEIDSSVKKIEIKEIKLREDNLLCVKIHADTRRLLKKAGKFLKDKSVIIWDDCDEDKLRSLGIQTVSPKKLYKYITDKIFVKALSQSGFLNNPKVCIFAGRISENEMGILRRISDNSRQISICAGNGRATAELLMENFGISAISGSAAADVVIKMYERDFSLSCIRHSRRYTLENVDIATDFDNLVPKSHLKSACVALLNRGALDIRGIWVKNLSFKCEN